MTRTCTKRAHRPSLGIAAQVRSVLGLLSTPSPTSLPWVKTTQTCTPGRGQVKERPNPSRQVTASWSLHGVTCFIYTPVLHKRAELRGTGPSSSCCQPGMGVQMQPQALPCLSSNHMASTQAPEGRG